MEVAAAQATQALQVYGLDLEVQGDWPEVVESVALDFAWFGTSPAGAAAERIVIERRPPDFDSLSALMPSFITPRNVVYSDGARQITRPPTSTCCRG